MKHFPGRELASITLAVGALVGILMLKHQCGQSVGNMFQALDSQPGGALSGPAAHKVAQPMPRELDVPLPNTQPKVTPLDGGI
jgi:hypothetical protein